MGLFRYVVQGFGWEVGSEAARETIRAARDAAADADERERQAALPPTKRELALLEKERSRVAAERVRTIERKKAEIEAELARLKKQK